MAQVFLTAATAAEEESDFNLATLRDLQKCAELNRFPIHSVTTDPATPDVIIFAESYGGGWYFQGVLRHPLVREYREKTFIYCGNPFVIPLLPGVYSGVEKRWSSPRTRAGSYLGSDEERVRDLHETSARPSVPFQLYGSIRNALVRQDRAASRFSKRCSSTTARSNRYSEFCGRCLSASP